MAGDHRAISPSQGAGHAILATARPAVRLLSPIAAALERRSAPRLLRLLAGALFARGRRTVTSWSRAAGITTDFRRAYWALWAAGRRAENLAFRLLRGPLAPLLALAPGDHLLFALDDTPTARYGPCVQGAGVRVMGSTGM